MKNSIHSFILFSCFTAILAGNANAAASLVCSGPNEPGDLTSFHTLYKGERTLDCALIRVSPRSKTGFEAPKYYTLHLEGFGPGLSASVVSGLMVNCPLVRAKKISTSGFYGVDAQAGLIFGGEVGVFVNKRLGVCTITGFDVSLGASIKGAKLSFEEYPNEN